MVDITVFYPATRILLGDTDLVAQQYPDAVLLQAVRAVMFLNKLPGFALTPDQNFITPDFGDPNNYALITYHTVKLFVQNRPERFDFKMRGYSEQTGNTNRFLSSIEAEIHALENGTMFSGWQSYFAWLHGMAGLPLGEVLAQFDVQAPLWKATFTRDGMKVA